MSLRSHLRIATALLASLGLAAGWSGPARATVLTTETQVFTGDGADIGSGLFERFDPALGVLQEVRLDWSSTYTASFDCPLAEGCTTVIGRGLQFFLPDSFATGGEETNSQSRSIGPVVQPQGPVTLEIVLEPLSEFRASDFDVDLNTFVGEGPVVDIIGSFEISASGIGSLSEDVTQTFENRFTLFYDFEPAVIAQPPTTWMLGGGLALLLALHARRRRVPA
jgi:hypothetical protein